MGVEYKYHGQKTCDRYIELSEQGKTEAQIAADLNVTVQSLYKWAKKHPEFKQARELGIDKCEAWWADYLQNKGTGDKHTKGDFQAAKWLMMNKFGWTDKQVNHLTSDDASIKIEIVRPEKQE